MMAVILSFQLSPIVSECVQFYLSDLRELGLFKFHSQNSRVINTLNFSEWDGIFVGILVLEGSQIFFLLNAFTSLKISSAI